MGSEMCIRDSLKAFPGFLWIDNEAMKMPEAEKLRLAKERITFPLVAFLIAAEEYSYFNYTWGYRAEHGAHAWYPEYDQKLGSPKGDARQKGYEYWREFEFASVYINIETKEATIDWHSANERAIDFADVISTEEPHVPSQFVSEYVHRSACTCLTGSGQPVKKRPRKSNGFRTQGERDENIRSSTNTTVENNLRIRADRVNYRLENVHGRW